jgi:NTE family protein
MALPDTRPDAGRGHRLALVLGSGGVRSIAAIGIAGRLAREGIRPDLIAGCSSGALFGAQIAMGMEGDEALRAATALWSPELTQQRRWRSYLQVVAPRLAGFGAGFAMRDDALIAQRVEAAFGDAQLQSLPTPLRVAATNAAGGTPVVLTTGSVAHAVRASMALPIIFPSIEIGGQRLVDGVISDPLPLAAAADARVAITLGFTGAMPRRIDRLSRMVAQTSTTLINNLMAARIAVARASGQRLISIDLELEQQIGLWDTSAMPFLFDAGWRACERRLPEIVAALEGTPAETPSVTGTGHPHIALAN